MEMKEGEKKERECGIEVVKNRRGGEGGERETLEMGGMTENNALEESRVAISTSCVCSGGCYIGCLSTKWETRMLQK